MADSKSRITIDTREFMRALKAAMSGTESLGGALDDVQESADGAGNALAGTGEKASGAGGQVAKLSGSLGTMVGGLAKALGPLVAVGAAIAGVATKAFDLATEAADVTDKIAKLSEVTGESAESLSRYQQLAEKALPSGGIDKIGEAFQKLNSEGGAKVLEEIGIAGDLTSEKFANLADWYVKTGNTAERSAELTKLFGDGLARELAPALALGADGIAKLQAENDAFGRTVDTETLGIVGAYKDAQQELSGVTSGLGQELTVLIPILTSAFKAMAEGVKAASSVVKGVKAAGEGMGFFAATLSEWIGTSKSWDEAADGVAKGLEADRQATEAANKATEDEIRAKNKAAVAARKEADAAKEAAKAKSEASAKAKAATDAYVKSLFQEQAAALAAAKAASDLGAELAKSLPALADVGAGLGKASDGAYALLPPIEDLGEQLDGIDASGMSAANTLGTIKDVAGEAWRQIRELTKALLETSLAFASLVTDTGVKALQFDIGGILDTFAEAIPAAIDKLRQFGAKAYEIMGRLFENMPEWIGEAGAAVGAALAVIGGAAAAAIKIVSGVVGAVNSLLKQFAGVDIVGLLTGDQDPAALFAQAGEALDRLVRDLPGRLAAVFESGALGEFFKTALDGLVAILPTALPAVVDFLTQAAGDLVRALPAILKALISSDLGGLIKDVLTTLADQLPVLIPQLIEIGAQIMIGIVESLPLLIAGIIKALPDIAIGLIQALGALFLGLIAGILDAVGLDKAAEKVSGVIDASYSDTPGLMQAGSGGAVVQFAPFDYFKASKAPGPASSFSDSRMVREMERGRSESMRGNAILEAIRDALESGGGSYTSINMRPV